MNGPKIDPADILRIGKPGSKFSSQNTERTTADIDDRGWRVDWSMDDATFDESDETFVLVEEAGLFWLADAPSGLQPSE